MKIQDWIGIIIEILAGLSITIPLVIELTKKVKEIVKEKDWNILVTELLKLMSKAEELYSDGASRKVWVMTGIKEFALALNYNYDEVAENKVSIMIDEICKASKILNKKIEGK